MKVEIFPESRDHFVASECSRGARRIIGVVEVSGFQQSANRRFGKENVAVRGDRRLGKSGSEKWKREAGRERRLNITIVSFKRHASAAGGERNRIARTRCIWIA